MESLTKHPLSTLPHVRALGRCAGRDPLTLFWTGSGIELLFTGSELWVEFNADYSGMEPWVSVELDGVCISRFAVNPGASRVCLFRGMAPGRAKHLRLRKDTQPIPNDPDNLLQITALEYAGGEFLPLPEPQYRLEFVGDSITSGEGAIGAVCEDDWVGAFFSAQNNYARMTADALNAEYRVVSQCGWGIVTEWNNNPHHAIPPYYTRVCGVAPGSRNVALGAQDPYDFAAWKADAVIINLGTNDDGAFHQPAWTDPDTGETFKLRTLPNGDYHPQDAARIANAVQDFLALVRRCNPDAAIVWVYGMLGLPLMPVLEQGFAQYRAASSDANVHLLTLPETTPATVGARQHPGIAAHRAAADVLAQFLRGILA